MATGERNLKLNIKQKNETQQQKDILGKDENEFIKKINNVYRQCDGYETYAQTTEFYDEDGVVLMTATQIDEHKIEFTFTEDGEIFEYETVNKEAGNKNLTGNEQLGQVTEQG